MGDTADRLSAEARKLFRHLPEGEITEDEPLFFRVEAGRLIVKLPGGDMYWREAGCAVRLRACVTPEGEPYFLRTWFRHGREVGPPRPTLN